MITKRDPFAGIAGVKMLVRPEVRFLLREEIDLFHKVMKWFFEQCLENSTWLGQDVYHLTEVGPLSSEQCEEVFKHVELYINCAGCNFSCSSLPNGNWMIAVFIGNPILQ